MPDEVVRAAGAVLWRPGPEIALVHRPRYDDWTFPKGKFKPGEHALRAAVREVWEETGVWPILGRRLPTAEYTKDGRLKRVEYWAGTGDGGDFTPNDEIDRVDWLPLDEAYARLSYARDADLLATFADSPLRTTPYIVARHTPAGEKRDWAEDDLLRPLDARGRTDAGDLAGLLACFGHARVFSSATARCLETVLPYAARVAAELRIDWAFTVGTAKGAGDRMAELLADDLPTLICTHGELVPDVVGHAFAELGAEPPDDLSLRKGGFWVLQVAAGHLVSAERHTLR